MSVPTELVALLYQAGRGDRQLSGVVRQQREAGALREESAGTLLVGRGGRFRAELSDEDGDTVLQVCDGRSLWTVGALESVRDDWSGGPIPFHEMLDPAWVLAYFDLDVIGRGVHAGRAVHVVTGMRRATSRFRKDSAWAGDRLEALVDADLGILLRYEVTDSKGRRNNGEFTGLRLDDPESCDPESFNRPDSIESNESAEHRSSERTSTVRPQMYTTSFRVPDDLINAIYHAGSEPQSFSAHVYERVNGDLIAETLRDIGASTSLAPVRALAHYRADRAPKNGEFSGLLHVALPREFALEITADPGNGSNKVLHQRKVHGRSDALPGAGLSIVVDPSWLLDGYQLSVSGIEEVGDRNAWRLVARPVEEVVSVGHGMLSGVTFLADKIDAVIDVNLGVALRLEWSRREQTILITELSKVSAGSDPGLFDAEVPHREDLTSRKGFLAAVSRKDSVKNAFRTLLGFGSPESGRRRLNPMSLD